MFDIGWTEMLVIGVVAVVVIGPKDLPRALRTAGQYIGKARSLARDFQHHIDDMIRESELDDLRQKANAFKADPANYFDNTIDKPAEETDPTGGTPDVEAPVVEAIEATPAAEVEAESDAETKTAAAEPANDGADAEPDADRGDAAAASGARG